MTTEIKHPDFLAYCRMQQHIQSLADRWVLAWTKFDYGYRNGASNVRFNQKENTIDFNVYIVDGIKWDNPVYSISAKYIDDALGLYSDSIAWYKADQEKRRKEFEELQRLKNTPDVKAYLTAEHKRSPHYLIS